MRLNERVFENRYKNTKSEEKEIKKEHTIEDLMNFCV